MKRTMTSSDITACPLLQPAQSCITFIAPETPTPLNCASQSSCFLSVNGTLYAAKLDGKCDEAQNDLIRHHGISPVATSAELYHSHLGVPTPLHLTDNSGRQGPVRCTILIAFTPGILTGLLFDVHEGA